MQGQAVDAINLATSYSGDLSMWGLFLKADLVVKLVMAVLVLASMWCWAIIFEKALRFHRLKTKTDDFEDRFWSGGSLEDLYDEVGETSSIPVERVFASAMREWRRSTAKGISNEGVIRANLRDRIGQVMNVTLNNELERLERHLGFLATVGSTAPFIGLLGTVWGIMNSFQAIAHSKNTNLAVVAPGIAEALFATALGLIAAIPAVVAYNKFSNDLGRYGNRLEGFAGEFSTILSRQLEEHP